MKRITNEYFNYYKYPRPETPENCEILNSIMKVKFMPINDYNSYMKKLNTQFKSIQLPVETNEHHISHYVRSVAENRNITEEINIIEDKTHVLQYKTSRPIIDIMNGRLLKAGLNPEILIPNNGVEDIDRKRKLTNLIDGFEKKINYMMKMTELQELEHELNRFDFEVKNQRKDNYGNNIRPRFTSHVEQEALIRNRRQQRDVYEVITWEGNLGEYMQRDDENDEPVDPDTLINLTDVIYYIEPQELYTAAQPLNDGTVMVGTAHVPKYLDTSEHFIQFDTKIEGTVIITPRAMDDRRA
jgi:hypothetical protein